MRSLVSRTVVSYDSLLGVSLRCFYKDHLRNSRFALCTDISSQPHGDRTSSQLRQAAKDDDSSVPQRGETSTKCKGNRQTIRETQDRIRHYARVDARPGATSTGCILIIAGGRVIEGIVPGFNISAEISFPDGIVVVVIWRKERLDFADQLDYGHNHHNKQSAQLD